MRSRSIVTVGVVGLLGFGVLCFAPWMPWPSGLALGKHRDFTHEFMD
jgi:hypothetical protein